MTVTDSFTLGLFDSTALSGWSPAVPTPAWDSDESDEQDANPAEHAANGGARAAAPVTRPVPRGRNYHLTGDRDLARGWPARARDNIAAIRLSKTLEQADRAPTPEEQARLLCFIGFGATELAQNGFRRPGEEAFRPGWEDIGAELESAVTPAEYAALQRATQYAHYTPEPVIHALWHAVERLGFTGGRVLEPGMGTGLFFALLPEALRRSCRLTGIEYDPVTARIARLVHPEARVHCEDYTRSKLGGSFDLAIGNPPFSDRVVRADPAMRALGLRLHDYFIARSIARLRPGGIALFVTSTGTMDKANPAARDHIAGMADLIGAVRLPEDSMRATAGTSVVADILVFQRRAGDQPAAGAAWRDLVTIANAATEDDDTDAAAVIQVNRYFAEHPEMVLGAHVLKRGIYGPGLAYTCRARPGDDLAASLAAALARLPAGIVPAPAETLGDDADTDAEPDTLQAAGTAAEGATVKEGSYLVGPCGRLMQVVNGAAHPVGVKTGRSGDGILPRDEKIIRALLPIRDAIRDVLRAQAADQPWAEAQTRLRIAYGTFVRAHGPINHTVIAVTTDPETGEERESHRRPNLAPFADDPDCWLVASIEDHDLETGLARMGAIFRERVIAPPAPPLIATAADALAVTLNETGRVDIDHLADLLDCDPDTALDRLGDAVFRDPATDQWETADAYLSGAVRTKLAQAATAAEHDPHYARNVEALRRVQPEDLPPSDITARLGAPWIPAADVEAFAAEVMATRTTIHHTVEIASWSVDAAPFAYTAAGTSEWGTSRRNAGWLLHDALNSATPQIFDTVIEDGVEKRVLNGEATEAAKEKLARIKDAFTTWVWTDTDRTDRLARLYNDRFNNLVPRCFDGTHLTLPGASTIIRLYPHQKRVIWRIVAAGSTYIAHSVGAGKSYAIAGAIMEQKRLGLIGKAMLVVPGHCLAQVSREFLQLYPAARILVADETNFVKAKRARFLARAATANWDAVIITHAAFRFIPVPAAFERDLIRAQIEAFVALAGGHAGEDRVTRKRIEAMKEKLGEKLAALKGRQDDMVTLEEIGIDQIIVDEAQEFRKLSFTTNQVNLKGVDPDGSQRAWDLFVKARFLDSKRADRPGQPDHVPGHVPGRALIQASGTPITNTLGETYTLLRFQAPEALVERGIHEFDAWASAFGDSTTELELQPSGAYKPVTRFASFINVADLMMLFRSVADVVQKSDLRGLLTLPRIRTGQRQLVTAEASSAFRDYQQHLAARIAAIEARKGKAQKGDDILLSVITDGRHAAIDMRLVWNGSVDEPANKLNRLIDNVHRIWVETADQAYLRPDGTPWPNSGAGQMIFSDLGTLSVEATRGFSAYRWIRQQLIARGVPAGQIAFMQDYRKSADKQRLFADFRAGRVRILIGSSETMGTGVNVQQRLKALHHLDVPWLPSQIEQREGRIERQGNQHGEIDIFAYATLGSMDATMWQNNERKARFIEAALSGDRTIRRIEDAGSQANQFAMAKAIASGDSRLMRKAGLEAEIARLQRQRAAHVDDQHAIRRQIRDARHDQSHAEARIVAVTADIAQRQPTRGDQFSMEVEGRKITQRKAAGSALLTKVRLALRERSGRHWTVGRIGGFDLVCDIRPGGPDGRLEPTLTLERTDLSQPISLDRETTAAGIIARLEHALDRMEGELEEQRRRAADAKARLAGYEPHLGETFPLQTELDDKRAQLARIEVDLAGTDSGDNGSRPAPALARAAA